MVKKKVSSKPKTPMKGLRIDHDLETRIDKFRSKLMQKTGLKVSFSSALRALIEQGLKAAQ